MRTSIAELLDQSTPFGRLALVHTLQGAGSTLITISLAGSLFFSISPRAAESKVLLYLLLTIAPFALVGPALSPLLDRGRQARRASVAIASSGSALFSLLMARDIHTLLLFPEAFAILVLSKLYLVARAALVPAFADRADDLSIANAKLAVLASVAGFAAFPFGLLALKIGPQWVLGLAMIVFLTSTVAALRLPRTGDAVRVARVPGEPLDGEPVPPAEGPGMADPARAPGARATRPSETRSRSGTHAVANGPLARLAAALEGVRAFREARIRVGLRLYPRDVLAAISAMSVARATVGFVEFFLAFGLRRAHAATWWYGALLAASGAGSLLGSTLVPMLRRHLSVRRIIAVALTAIAAGSLGAALLGGLVAQALLTFVVGVGPTSAKPALDSIVQRHVPPALLGRAFGRLETRLQLSWVAASLVGVLVPFPLRWGDVVVAVACVLAAVSYASVVRGASSAPTPAPRPPRDPAQRRGETGA